MITLIEPTEKYLQSYIEAYNEYVENDISTYAFTDAASCDIFAKFDDYKNERNLRPDRVGADYYWLVDDEKELFIGEVSIRHHLNDALMQYGGHIGYGIRYSEWGHGYGTRLLNLALMKAKEMGISYPMITCDDDNIASAKVIEKNGFILFDKVENCVDGVSVVTRRYIKSLV